MLNDQIRDVIAALKTILTTNATNLPNISISNNSVFKNVYDHFSCKNIEVAAGLSNAEFIIAVLDNLEIELLAPENKQYVSSLVNFSTELTVGLNEVYSLMSTRIPDHVDSIVSEIHKTMTGLFERNNLSDLINENQEITADHLKEFHWTGVKSPSVVLGIIEKLKDVLNFPSSDVTKANFNLALNSLTDERIRKFEPITDENDIIAIRELSTAVSEHQFFNLLINKDSYRSLFKDYSGTINELKFLKNNISKMCVDMVAIKSLINTVTSNSATLSTALYSKLKNNINILNITVAAVQFVCVYFKETLFDNTIIINKQLINGPVFESLQKNGVTKVTLASYLRAYYSEKDIPISGIKAGEIDMNQITSKLAAMGNDRTIKQKLYTKKFLREAFSKTLGTKFDDLYDAFNGIIKDVDYAKTKKQYHLLMKKKSDKLFADLGYAEKAVYRIIIELFFKSTMVEAFYDIFGRKIAEQLEPGNNVDNIVALTADASVEVVMMFMLKYFVKINE